MFEFRAWYRSDQRTVWVALPSAGNGEGIVVMLSCAQRPRYTAVALGLAALIAASCGQGRQASVGADGGASQRTPLPSAVIERIRADPPSVAPEMAASGGNLLVVGGLELVEDTEPFLRVAAEAVLVDVSSGKAEPIPAPESGGPVYILGATADQEGFIVVGQRCTDGGRLPLDDWLCAPGSGTAFRLDLDAPHEWREIPFPESAPSLANVATTFQPIVGTTPAGQAFVAVRSGVSGPTPKLVRILTLEGEVWKPIAEFPDARVVEACASSEAFFVLTSGTSVQTNESASSTEFTLHEVPITGGGPSEVSLPDVDTSMGGVAVAMACDRSGPYLTSSKPNLESPMSVLALRGGKWQQIVGDWTPELVHRLGSAPNGVVLVSLVTRRAETLMVRVIGAGETTARALPSEYVSRHFIADATSGGFITVGPVASLGVAAEQDNASDVTVDRLEP